MRLGNSLSVTPKIVAQLILIWQRLKGPKLKALREFCSYLLSILCKNDIFKNTNPIRHVCNHTKYFVSPFVPCERHHCWPLQQVVVGICPSALSRSPGPLGPLSLQLCYLCDSCQLLSIIPKITSVYMYFKYAESWNTCYFIFFH